MRALIVVISPVSSNSDNFNLCLLKVGYFSNTARCRTISLDSCCYYDEGLLSDRDEEEGIEAAVGLKLISISLRPAFSSHSFFQS